MKKSANIEVFTESEQARAANALRRKLNTFSMWATLRDTAQQLGLNPDDMPEGTQIMTMLLTLAAAPQSVQDGFQGAFDQLRQSAKTVGMERILATHVNIMDQIEGRKPVEIEDWKKQGVDLLAPWNSEGN